MNTDKPPGADDALGALFKAVRSEGAPYIQAAGGFGRLEYGFETRVMARVREERSPSWIIWAMRLCPFATALAVAAGVWTAMHWEDSPGGEGVVDAMRFAGVPVLEYYLGGEQ